MNIHLPAILMFTRGTRFWHTAIFILVIQIFPMSGLSQPEAPDLGCQVARSNDSTNQRRGHEVYKTGDPGGGASSLEVAWSIFLWIHQEKGALARKIIPEPSWNQIFLSSAKTLCVACGVLGYEGTCASGVVLWTWPPFFGVLDFAGPMQHCSVLFYLLFLFFPTSLCGVLVFDSVSLPLRRLPLLRPLLLFVNHHLSHTIFHTPSLTHIFVNHHLSHTHNFVTHTHNFVTHTQLCHTPSFTHTTLSHTTLSHTQLCHTHNFVNHHLSHTTLSTTIFHTPSFTHNFDTHATLSHTQTHNFVTHHLSHTTLSPTIFHTQLCVAGVALMANSWHLAKSTLVLRGRRGISCTWWRAWSPLVARAPRHFAWQVGHLVTPTFVSRGRRGTWRHLPLFCVAGVGQVPLGGALGRRWSPGHFAWQVWRLVTSTLVSRGRRGTWRQAWHLVTSTFVSRGRRGTWRHLPAFGVAGVAEVALGGALGRRWSPGAPRHFAWQVWHLVTSTFVSRGRRGTWRHLPAFGVAGVAEVALGGALGRRWSPRAARHFAWQAWHKVTSTLVSRGRRGTWRHLPSFCVAGGALGRRWSPGAPRHFAWQAWHKVTSTLVSRGRCCTWRHLPLFCVAGVAEVALGGTLGRRWSPGAPRHFAWQAWHKVTFSYPAMNFWFCAVTAVSDMLWCLCTASWDPAHCSFAAVHLSHTGLSHTIFHTQLSHTRSFTQNFVTHIIFFVAHHLSYTNLSRTTLHIQLVLRLDPPPPPLSFLPSPSPLQHLVLIIGRRWLVGLSGLTMS